MLFNSLKYAIFLPVVLAVFWLSPARWRVPILLIASYVFYMAWRPIYLLLILGLTVVNYWLGLRIWQSKQHKKAWMVSAVAVNLLVLAYFKYFYFLEDTIALLTKPWFGEFHRLPINVILPLGISFFVFEFVHYVIDVYRGSEPVHDFMSFALFPAFFPTQIAGPIKRFQDFVPQLKIVQKFSITNFDQGMFLILSGLFKKVLLADNLALYVSAGFSNPQMFTGVDLWLYVMAFNFQIYFDFAGYADIARGSAKLFGYSVPINFDFPYLSGNVTDMWKRWHITLGSWLRDYVYTPIGWTRSKAKIARNLIITMTVGGLWHGAAFHYVIWGTYQGLLLAGHREFALYRRKHPSLSFFDSYPGHVFSIALTFISWTLGAAIFRAENTTSALLILRKMLFLDGFKLSGSPQDWCSLLSVNYPLIFPSFFVVLLTLLVGQVLVNRITKLMPIQYSPRLMKVAFAVSITFLLIAFSPDNSPRFIYYQF